MARGPRHAGEEEEGGGEWTLAFTARLRVMRAFLAHAAPRRAGSGRAVRDTPSDCTPWLPLPSRPERGAPSVWDPGGWSRSRSPARPACSA